MSMLNQLVTQVTGGALNLETVASSRGQSLAEYENDLNEAAIYCARGQRPPSHLNLNCGKQHIAGKLITGAALSVFGMGLGTLASQGAQAFGFAPAAVETGMELLLPSAEATNVSLLGDLSGFINTGLSAYQQIQGMRQMSNVGMSTLAPIAMGAMPQVARALPAIAGAAGGMIVRGAGSAMRSAAAYCRRNPTWCASIGGTAAIAAMVQNGQLPPVRRRRRRGISGRDLGAYRRVHNLLAGFCSPKAKIRKSC